MEKFKKDLENILEILKSEKDVVSVYLYGSFASEKERYNSDIDIGILFDKDINSDRFKKLYLKINSDTVLDVDLVKMNEASLILLHQILKNGKLILCNNKKKDILFRKRVIIDYADLQILYRKNIQNIKETQLNS